MEAVGRFIGRRLAEVVMFLRDKPFIPCQVDWYRGNGAWDGTDEHREAIRLRAVVHPTTGLYVIDRDKLKDPTAPTLQELNEHARYFNGGK